MLAQFNNLVSQYEFPFLRGNLLQPDEGVVPEQKQRAKQLIEILSKIEEIVSFSSKSGGFSEEEIEKINIEILNIKAELELLRE